MYTAYAGAKGLKLLILKLTVEEIISRLSCQTIRSKIDIVSKFERWVFSVATFHDRT